MLFITFWPGRVPGPLQKPWFWQRFGQDGALDPCKNHGFHNVLATTGPWTLAKTMVLICSGHNSADWPQFGPQNHAKTIPLAGVSRSVGVPRGPLGSPGVPGGSLGVGSRRAVSYPRSAACGFIPGFIPVSYPRFHTPVSYRFHTGFIPYQKTAGFIPR